MQTEAVKGERAAGLDGQGLKVFVSYSRRDLDFAEQLVVALEALGYTVIIDRRGIHGAERWEDCLGQMIVECDTVVFVLTPASVASTVCRWEVDQAIEHRKRMVPVLAAPLDAASVPHPGLRDFNYIFFYPDPSFPGAGWGSGIARLLAALCVDIARVREQPPASMLLSPPQQNAPSDPRAPSRRTGEPLRARHSRDKQDVSPARRIDRQGVARPP